MKLFVIEEAKTFTKGFRVPNLQVDDTFRCSYAEAQKILGSCSLERIVSFQGQIDWAYVSAYGTVCVLADLNQVVV